MSEQKLISQNLGANPETPNECRIHDGSFHVNYAITTADNPGIVFDNHTVETENLTHTEIIDDEDYDGQTNWMTQVVEDKLEIFIFDDDCLSEVHQFVSAQTCLQLADMFRRAGEKLVEEKAKKDAEDARIKEINDSSLLPFTE